MTSRPFRLSPPEKSYLQNRLNQVSRSFALVVPCLEEPLCDYLATAYLICRVIDNIEDCGQPFGWQKQRFAEVQQLLQEPQRAADTLRSWQNESWPALTAHEASLMGLEQGEKLWSIYASLPTGARAAIARWTHEMAVGMEQVEDLAAAPWMRQQGDLRILAEEADYNRYCYIVAGTVGHMATELVIDHYDIEEPVASRLNEGAEVCGRSLQKTNIIKDFAEDRQRGVCYLPAVWMAQVANAPLALAGAPIEWQYELLSDVRGELREATEYVLNLPLAAAGYRTASLLCLTSAYQTILRAARSTDILFTPKHRVKISRVTMARCMHDARKLTLDNDAVRQYSQKVEQEIEQAFSVVPVSSVF